MIKHCKYSSGATIYPIYDGHVVKPINTREEYVTKGDLLVIDLRTYESGNLEFYLDDNSLDSGKPDQAKWAFVYEMIYRDLDDAESAQSLWAPIGSNEEIAKLNIGTNYKVGSSLHIEYTSTTYFLGFKQRVVVFESEADLDDPFYFYIIPISDPEVGFASFRNSDILRKYGETVTLEFLFHNYPPFSPADNAALYKAKVYIFDKDEGAGLIDTSDLEEKNLWETAYEFDLTLPDYRQKDYMNVYHEYSFLVDSNWRGAERREKEYSVVLELYRKKDQSILSSVYETFGFDYELVTTKNYIDNPGGNIVIYDANDNSIKEIPNSISSFRVAWDTMGEILESREINTQNMIAYVGDSEYSIKEYNPCAYTKIEVKSESDAAVVLFDEHENLDNTRKATFGLIAGEGTDNRKSVLIIAGYQQSKGDTLEPIQLAPKVRCDQILNNGEDHTSTEDVFKMGYIIGQWQPSFLNLILTSGWNVLNDNSPEKGRENTASVYSGKTVAEVQGLSSADYQYIENGISLFLQYHYNKTILEGTVMHQQMMDSLWMFRYFFLSENVAQTYFVPVTTCRYPNQVAEIKVYPDMEWELSLSVGSDNPQHYSYVNSSSGIVSRNHWRQATDAGNNRRWSNGDVVFELSLKAATGGIETELQLAYSTKIKPILELLIGIKSTLDEYCHVTEVKKGMAKNIADLLKTDNPITFQLDYPVIGINGSWKYGIDPRTNKIAKQGEINLGFKPLIKGTGKLDIITCAEYIPTAGKIIRIARWIVSKIEGRLWFNLYVQGEIALDGSIYLNQNENLALNSATTVTIGIELGAALAAEVEKVNFEAANVQREEKATFGGEISAKGETSITLNANAGNGQEGFFLEISADFGGLVAIVNAKLKGKRGSVGISDRKMTIVEPIPELFKKRIDF